MLAVSGGVDSMALLDSLRAQSGVELIVAHFDHGIRADSAEDRKLVQRIAATHNLPFIYDEARLGAQASEAAARAARYDFLERVRTKHGAQAIITAHHQDDVLETMLLNLLRGTGRKGLASLASGEKVVRPLLGVPKSELREYAAAHNLAWREDSTNADPRYRRNFVRQHVVPKFAAGDRQKMLAINHRMFELNEAIDAAINDWLATQPAPHTLSRAQFILLPHNVACEVMIAFIRQSGAQNVGRKLIEQLVAAAKTARAGTLHDIDQRLVLKVLTKNIAVIARA